MTMTDTPPRQLGAPDLDDGELRTYGFPAGAVTYWLPANPTLYRREGLLTSPRTHQGICFHTIEDPTRAPLPSWYQEDDASAAVGYFVSYNGDIYQLVRDRDLAFAQSVDFLGDDATARYPLPTWFSRTRHRDFDHSLLSISVAGCSDSPMTYPTSFCAMVGDGDTDEGIGASLQIGDRQWAALIALSTYLVRRYGIPIEPDRFLPHSRLAIDKFDPGPGFPLASVIRAVEAMSRDITPFGATEATAPRAIEPSGQELARGGTGVAGGRLLPRAARLRLLSGGTLLDIDQRLRIRFEIHYDTEDGDKAWKAEIYNLAPSTEADINTYREGYQLSAGYGDALQVIATGSVLAIERSWEPPNRVTKLLLDNALAEPASAEVVSISALPSRSYVVKLDEIVRALGGTVENADQFPELQEVDNWVFTGSPREALNKLADRLGLAYTIAFGVIRLSRKAVEQPRLTLSAVRPEEFDLFSEEGTSQFEEARRAFLTERSRFTQERAWFNWLQQARMDIEVAERSYEVSMRTGMIGQPTLTEKGIKVRTRIMPALLPNRLIELKSRTISGDYIIYAASHVGDTWEGEMYTEVKGIPAPEVEDQ